MEALSNLPSAVRDSVRRGRPEWVSPMLATLVDEPFSRPGWLFEPKFDGQRAIVVRRGKRIELYSRNRKPLNEKYPELVKAFEKQKTSFILDGEIVAFAGQVTSFMALQSRMQVQRPTLELLRHVPVFFYAFDIPFFEGYDL